VQGPVAAAETGFSSYLKPVFTGLLHPLTPAGFTLGILFLYTISALLPEIYLG